MCIGNFIVEDFVLRFFLEVNFGVGWRRVGIDLIVGLGSSGVNVFVGIV